MIAETGDYPFIVRQRNIDVVVPTIQLPFGNAILSRYPIVEAKRKYPLPMVVTGDFNSTVGDRSDDEDSSSQETALEALNGSGLFKPFPDLSERRYTFPSERSNRTIDWILLPKSWNIEAARVVETTLSDHLPVTVTVTVQPNPPE